MFKSKYDMYVKSSRFSSISWILGIENGFLQILWFSFLKLENNCTFPLFFSWMKVGCPHSKLFAF